jgi:hypothetical protein
MVDVVVTLTPVNLATLKLDDSQPTITLTTNPNPSLVIELGQILRGLPGKDGITHAITLINTDSNRPVAYCGYEKATDNSQHIARLDYTSGQQPTVTRAAVTSVSASWAGRASLTYL